MLSALLDRPLAARENHVWSVPLETGLQDIKSLYSLLSVDEIVRAERFYFERDRTRYIIGRGVLRTLLGNYLGIEATGIKFVYGVHGKPAVDSATSSRKLEFNLAHSNDRVIYIFSWDCPVGIDLESVRPLQDADRFAQQFYSVRETALIRSLAGDEKWDTFYKFWTCKEALLKATGSGLTVPLQQVEILLENDNTAKILSIGGDIEQADDWGLEIFSPLPGYQAAVAFQKAGQVQNQHHTIRKFEIPSLANIE